MVGYIIRLSRHNTGASAVSREPVSTARDPNRDAIFSPGRNPQHVTALLHTTACRDGFLRSAGSAHPFYLQYRPIAPSLSGLQLGTFDVSQSIDRTSHTGREVPVIFEAAAKNKGAYMMVSRTIMLLLTLLLAGSLAGADDSIKQGGKEVGQGVKKMGKATGKAVVKSGKATGKAFKKAGKATGKAFRESGKATGEAFQGN